MKLFNIDGTEVKVYKTKYWPKIYKGKNTVWYETAITIDESGVNVYWESARGQCYYFIYKGQRYRMPFNIKMSYLPFIEANIDIDFDGCALVTKTI